jgi:epoxide hydrolase 4
MTVEIHYRFDVLNGVRHNIAEAGSGPPLMLLHGWPEFNATWEPLIARLAGRYRLIAPDYRGFGDSDHPVTGPSDQAGAGVLAADIAQLIDRLGVGPVGVVGHDMGAFVMQRLALDHPGRARALFFFNCPTPGVGARWRDVDQIPEIWYQTFHQMPHAAALCSASREACRAHIGHFLRHWSHRKDAFDAVLERWVECFMRPGNMQGGFNWYISQNAGRLATMAGRATPQPMITLPTRVLWGRHDPVLKSAWADEVPRHFSDAEVSFAEGSGHFVHYEEPDLAAAEIDRFFSRLS